MSESVQTPMQIVRHPVLQIANFLPEQDVAFLLQTALALEPKYVPSAVSDAKEDYRKSLSMEAPAQVAELVSAKIRTAFPLIIQRLGLRAVTFGRIECQLTANNDASYFRIHTDAGHNNTVTRQLTFVYYFNHDPKGFEGGELRIYDDQVRNNKLARIDSFQVVQPRHNSIVFFQAAVMHEVTPVHVPSKLFRDCRFTVNGWIHRAA